MGGERYSGSPPGGGSGEAVELLYGRRCYSRQRGETAGAGQARPNAVKFFSSIELITLLADREWLDDATKTIGQYWRRKNAQRHGLAIEEQADAPVVVRKK